MVLSVSTARQASIVRQTRTTALKAPHAALHGRCPQPRRESRRSRVAVAAASSASPAALESGSPAPLQLPEADSRFEGLRVLVAGATGGVGKAVVKQLSEQGIPVRALVRDGVKASSMLPAASRGVEIVEGDVYKFSTIAKAMEGCNAVICATGPTDRLNPLGPFTVDCEGTKNLVAAAQQQRVRKFVLVTSIGCDDPLFPLNAYWGVLFWKKQGEVALQRSGLDYTIIRPGGLVNEVKNGRGEGRLVMGGPDFYGLPPRQRPGSVLRSDVAACCVSALVEKSASSKVVEIISEKDAPARPIAELFASV